MARGPQYYAQNLPAQYDEASYQGASIANDMEHTTTTEQKKLAQYQYHESNAHYISSGPGKYVAGEQYQAVPASSPQLLALRKKDLVNCFLPTFPPLYIHMIANTPCLPSSALQTTHPHLEVHLPHSNILPRALKHRYSKPRLAQISRDPQHHH